MTEARSDNFQYYLARALLKKLWVKGLISEEEMKRIDERNKASFGFQEVKTEA
jgi:hypothetical protein